MNPDNPRIEVVFSCPRAVYLECPVCGAQGLVRATVTFLRFYNGLFNYPIVQEQIEFSPPPSWRTPHEPGCLYKWTPEDSVDITERSLLVSPPQK